MMPFLTLIIVIAIALVIGAKFHEQINSKLSRILNKDDLPVDFRIWLRSHAGEYNTIGAAMSAWADAKYGDKYDNLLK